MNRHVYAKGSAVTSRQLTCGHCNACYTRIEAEDGEYADHVKGCIAKAIAGWDEVAYSKRYFEQVRKISRFQQPGDPRRRRSLFRMWAWATVRPDGLPIQSLLPVVEVS